MPQMGGVLLAQEFAKVRALTRVLFCTGYAGSELVQKGGLPPNSGLIEKPFSPDRVRFALMAAAVGLFLALGVTAVVEYRDMTLRTEDEIVRTLVLPVIAAIPIMTAIADLRRQRRNKLVLTAVTVTTIVAVSAAAWQLVR